MAKYIGLKRLRNAINNLATWRDSVQSQASAHLFPLLAIIYGGVTKGRSTLYGEQNDKAFYDQHFLIPVDADFPYFDPVKGERRIATWPHSSVSTLRKNTFGRRWNAGVLTELGGQDTWQLADEFATILQHRMLTKSREVTRPNVIDVATWLFKYDEFEDAADSFAIQVKFRREFKLTNSEYETLFEFRDEPADHIFSSDPLSKEDVASVVSEFTTPSPEVRPTSPKREANVLDAEDPILSEVHHVLEMRTSGIIFRGCPGTGKTWYAWNIALALTDNKPTNISRVQFHSSYGYEDFVEGYRPCEESKSGFKIVDSHFLTAVESAKLHPEETFVFIIDEINRGDPSRIFGEVLTYLEYDWRESHSFLTPYSGKSVSIPRNLIVLATMNPYDRSITQLDLALLRRFDHIDISPSAEKVDLFLAEAGMGTTHATEVVSWFETLQDLLPSGIGHTYFISVSNVQQLMKRWQYRIRPFCEVVLEFDHERLQSVTESFNALVKRLQEVDFGT